MTLVWLAVGVLLFTVPFLSLLVMIWQRSWRLVGIYGCAAGVALIVGWLMTYRCEYFVDGNTKAFGWPLPYVVFQRDTPDGPWLDYTGWTTTWAFPIHSLMVLFFPSVFLLFYARRRATVAATTSTSSPTQDSSTTDEWT
jgi:hypothetical protein